MKRTSSASIKPSNDTAAAEPLPAFHYLVPADLESLIAVGQWVWVPFGSRNLSGIVVALDSTPPDIDIRPIGDIVDVRPVLAAAQLALARWISEHYLAPLFDCLRLFLPPGAAPRTETVYSVGDASAAAAAFGTPVLGAGPAPASGPQTSACSRKASASCCAASCAA